jgi:protein-S-isoprenylcysteine O-methyltransferase Ste14
MLRPALSQQSACIIFESFWLFLLFVAVAAQIILGKKKQVKLTGSVFWNLMVVLPYFIVFGWYSIRQYWGTFPGNLVLQISGITLMFIGVAGYMASIACLQQQWAISVTVKVGHQLIKNGPYRIVRHPMYFFMLLEVLGSGLLISNFMILLYLPVVFGIYFFRARKEEELLLKGLPDYGEYAKKTRMIIPGIF